MLDSFGVGLGVIEDAESISDIFTKNDGSFNHKVTVFVLSVGSKTPLTTLALLTPQKKHTCKGPYVWFWFHYGFKMFL